MRRHPGWSLQDWIDSIRISIRDNGILYFRCPACKGESEERECAGGYEGVTWRCAYCNGYGTVGLWKKILFLFWR